MRLLYAGRKPIGAQVHRMLQRHIVAVVTNVERESWYGTFAPEVTVPIYDSLKRAVRESKPDAVLSVQHPSYISPRLIEAVEGRAWNLHLAPLPEYRGYHGPTLAILDGATEYGVTLHWIDAGLDTGPIAYESRFAVRPDDTARSLYTRAETHALELVKRLAVNWTPPKVEQAGTPKGRDSAPERRITSMDDVDRKARAFYFPPFPGAYIEANGRRFTVAP